MSSRRRPHRRTPGPRTRTQVEQQHSEPRIASGGAVRNRGRCDFCANEYQLRRDGGVRVHTTGCYFADRSGTYRPRYCPGSALLPRPRLPEDDHSEHDASGTRVGSETALNMEEDR